MLRELSFKTIGDIDHHGLELHVYCSRCFATRRLELEVNTALHGRAFATTRFRCRRCGTPGLPKIGPAELLQVSVPVTLCVPVVRLMRLGDRPGPARQAAMVGKPPALSLPWLRWAR